VVLLILPAYTGRAQLERERMYKWKERKYAREGEINEIKPEKIVL
jgi:hypothetical protein